MGKLSSALIPITLWLVLSCGADDFPDQFRGDQVERLLTGGDSALWGPTSILANGEEQLNSCADSVHFLISLTTNDSLNVLQLSPGCFSDNIFDTLNLGNAKATTEDGIFTDTLSFETGAFWLIETIFSQTLIFSQGDTRYSLQSL